MRAHLHPDTTPTDPATDGGWLRLSAALTRQAARLAGRDDLIVSIAPGHGHGSPGCFLPELATIELDGDLLPQGVHPARARPGRLRDRERYPACWGVLCHEAAHARHTRWQPPQDTPRHVFEAAKLLEEPRIEARQLTRRPGDRRWLRAAIRQLILDEVDGLPILAAAEQTAAIVLGRVDAGILEPDETAPIAKAITAAVGAGKLAALRPIWQAALTIHDDDTVKMLELARRWCDITNPTPPAGPPGVSSPATAASPPRAGMPTGGPSPITAAVRTVIANVAANDHTDHRPTAPSLPGPGSAEATARRRAKRTATSVFTPHTHPGHSGPAIPARWRYRPPSPKERAAARRLARQLRDAIPDDRTATRHTFPVPPGRLQLRAALAADAQRAAGTLPTVEPWLRKIHRHTPTPPLAIGIAVDISASMRAFANPLASTAWVLAQAAAWADATLATVAFGEQVVALTHSGTPPAQVLEFHADHQTEQVTEAIDALDGALHLASPGHGARLLVIVSDGYYTPQQRTSGQARTDRLRAHGCAILWLALRPNPKPFDGTQLATLDDPTAAIGAITTAARQALRAALR